MLISIIRGAKAKIDRRRRYGRVVAEIESLTYRDLVDMGASRDEMLDHAYREFYGN